MARPLPAAALEAPPNPGSADPAGGRRDGQDAVLAAPQFRWLISLGPQATLTPPPCRRRRRRGAGGRRGGGRPDSGAGWGGGGGTNAAGLIGRASRIW